MREKVSGPAGKGAFCGSEISELGDRRVDGSSLPCSSSDQPKRGRGNDMAPARSFQVLVGAADETNPGARAAAPTRRAPRRRRLGCIGPERHRRSRSLGLLLGAVLASPVLASVSSTAIASTQPARAGGQSSPVQLGLKFYKGKVITFISQDAPGGGFDTWSRILAPFMATYLQATINVENIPTANGVTGQDYLAGSTPNGLTVGWLNPLQVMSHQITNTPGVNFNPERVAFLGSTAANASTWVVDKTSACPWSSWSSLMTSTNSANPVRELDMAGSTTDLFQRLADISFGITPLIISGYVNTAAELQGFVRGDGCLAELPLSSAGPLLQQAKAVPVAIESPVSPDIAYASTLSGIPTMAQLGKAHPPTNRRERTALSALLDYAKLDARVLMTPGATPSDRVAALRWAMKKAMTNPALVQRALAVGDNPGFGTGEVAKANYIAGLKIGKSIAPDLS